LGVIYVPGPSVLVVNSSHFSLAKNAPAEPHPRPTFKDCVDCPEMIALPTGEFMMGSPEISSDGLHQPA